MPLTAERTALATVDEQLVGLLLERAKILRNIASIKRVTNTAILQQDEWEFRQTQRRELLSCFPKEDQQFVLQLFNDLHAASVQFQKAQL